MRRVFPILILCALAVPGHLGAQAQQTPDTTKAVTTERLGENHVYLTGNVELTFGDTTLFADKAELFQDQNRVVATGNVVVTQGKNRISADRADFDTKTHLGTFYNATGLATIQPPKQAPPQPGGFAPPVSNQPTDVYFYGDKVEKIGLKKYRITNGGFSTCVQPTPRWELTSGTVVLNVDHYTLLRNAVFKVKGLPFLYTPFMYYPTKKDDRATGILIPTFGSSTLHGSSLHNAFFWAINRSEDATFFHDWYSTTGQGVGSEYRYNYGAGANGFFRGYMLDQHATTYTLDNGQQVDEPASHSYELKGGANQLLPFHLRARANVNYFSSLQEVQTFNVNLYDASTRQRVYGGNVVGTWNTWNLNATIDHSEFFYGDTSSTISGNTPRVALTRSERPIWSGSPLYFSLGGEYAHLLAESKDTTDPANPQIIDHSVTRLDFQPQIRYPFTKWQWFTVNSTASWRDTYYTRTCSPTTDNTQGCTSVVDESLNRQFFTVGAQMVGPVFTKIWDTPNNSYAEKFKHSIEPFFDVSRTSNIDNYNRIIQIDQTDTIVGGATQLTYGINNRFYAKRRQGRAAAAREILTIGLSQTYYTDARASQYDAQYMTSFTGGAPSNFSPIALTVRAIPTNTTDTTMRAEFDSHYHSLRTISLSQSYALSGHLQVTGGWSKKYLIPELQGFNDPTYLDQYINASTNVHTRDSRIGGIYQFNYDVLHSSMTQQQMSAYYNAQCCGVAFQYITFNYGAGGFSPLPSDNRFFLSFTLAGLGNFSPFNGAMSGMPH